MERFRILAETVFETIGTGFNEVVYQNALEVELRLQGTNYERERIIPIYYKNHQIGIGRADIIVENKFILELKAVCNLNGKETKQLEHYLNYTGIQYGAVINFNQNTGEIDFQEVELVND